jgi:serine/threonine-protein kinase RsbW
MAVHRIFLEIPSAVEYVSLVRQTMEGIARRMHFDPTEVGDVKLAVGEALNNAVSHGCPSAARARITVVCTIAPTSLEIQVSNAIAAGRPRPTIADAVDNEREGGMGLFIMRQVMDEVEIVWEDRSATVRMVKRMKRGRGAPRLQASHPC